MFTRKVKLPIEPPPDPVSAAETTGKVIDWAEATAETFKKTNQDAQQFPLWQELQLLGFIRYVGLYASDLKRAYSSSRLDSLAQALRNLAELDVWVEFCLASEENAKHFFADMARDTREVIEIHNKLHLHVHKASYEGFDNLIKTLIDSSSELQLTNLKESFTPVSRSAKDVGRDLKYAFLYKIASKYAHPTALLLNAKSTDQRVLMDRFYEGGSRLAYSCAINIQKIILKKYPNSEL
jgi:hypothetical protein